MPTPYQQHREQWINCQRCELHKQRTQVVLARGTIPAQILFIGEAPGQSEDVLGSPFKGPAGKLLDYIVANSIPSQYSYAMTNIVACIPRGDDGDKVALPPEESIKACAPRLVEFVNLCKPQLIICVGSLATK